MAITCRQICELKSCSKLTLLAGKSAIDREVTWPYIKSVGTLAEWLHGGEIVFVLGNHGEDSEENLLSIMEEAKKANITALVILTDSEHIRTVPKSMKKKANEYDIALYKLPFKQKLIDITREISHLIMAEQMKDSKVNYHEEDTCLTLLFRNVPQEEILLYCFRKLQPLSEADQVTGSELVKTLYVYLMNGNDLLHSSEKMFIHRNTMIGRMKKVHSLLGIDVNDPLIRTDFIEIFEVLRLYGMLDSVIKK